MSAPRDQARALLGLKAQLRTERARVASKARQQERESRQRRRARLLAEQAELTAVAALARDHVPAHVIDARRRLLSVGVISDGFPGRDAADAEARLALRLQRHKPGKATYWSVIGDPPKCGPGDRAAAAIFLRRVQRAIEQGGWTTNERAALHMLEKRWGARARGTDGRFNVVGNVSGRLPRDVERTITILGD
jgi:hypothetical protein